jgi:hypothetical protein
MIQLRIEIGVELTTLIISFRRTMLIVSICLELLEQRSFVFCDLIRERGLLEDFIHMCVE